MSPALVKEKRERLKEKLARLKKKKELSPEEIADLFEEFLEYSDTVEESIEKDNLKPISLTLEKHEAKINEVEISLRQLIDMVREEMHMGFEAMDKRFEAMNERFEAMDKRFEAMDKRFEALQREMNARFEALQRELDSRFELLKEGQNRLWTFILWWVPFWIGVYTAILKFLIFK